MTCIDVYIEMSLMSVVGVWVGLGDLAWGRRRGGGGGGGGGGVDGDGDGDGVCVTLTVCVCVTLTVCVCVHLVALLLCALRSGEGLLVCVLELSWVSVSVAAGQCVFGV